MEVSPCPPRSSRERSGLTPAGEAGMVSRMGLETQIVCFAQADRGAAPPRIQLSGGEGEAPGREACLNSSFFGEQELRDRFQSQS
jgi:hypothetical protein